MCAKVSILLLTNTVFYCVFILQFSKKSALLQTLHKPKFIKVEKKNQCLTSWKIYQDQKFKYVLIYYKKHLSTFLYIIFFFIKNLFYEINLLASPIFHEYNPFSLISEKYWGNDFNCKCDKVLIFKTNKTLFVLDLIIFT